MNKCTLLAVLLFVSYYSVAQDTDPSEDSKKGLQWNYLLLDAGLNFTKFSYMDSRDEQSLITDMTNSPKEKFAVGLGISPAAFDRLELHLGLANNNKDVKAYFQSGVMPSYVHYDFDFMTAELGLNLRLFDLGKEEKRWSFLVNGGLGFNWLLAGFQERNGSFVDLKAYELFNNRSTDYNYGGSLRKKISPYSSLQFSYRLKYGLELEEQATDGKYERYTFKTDVFSVGFLIDIPAVADRYKKEKKIEDLAQKMIDKMAEGDSTEQLMAEKIRKMMADHNSLDREVAKNTNDLEDLNEQLIALEQAPKNNSSSTTSDFAISENKRLILFPFGKSQFYDVFKVELKALVELMKENPTDYLELVGYADIIGSGDYNVALSKKRAERVRDFLVKQGVSKNRIKVDYLGSTSKFDKYNFLFNRRVEITIIKK